MPAQWDRIRALVAGHDVILELAGACQLDAAGLGVLAGLRRHLSAGDNTLTLVAHDPRTRQLLALVGLLPSSPSRSWAGAATTEAWHLWLDGAGVGQERVSCEVARTGREWDPAVLWRTVGSAP